MAQTLFGCINNGISCQKKAPGCKKNIIIIIIFYFFTEAAQQEVRSKPSIACFFCTLVVPHRQTRGLVSVFLLEGVSCISRLRHHWGTSASTAAGEHVYANQLAWSAASLAPTRQGILPYKSCYLYPSQVLSLPVPFINAGVGFPQTKVLN